MSPDPPSAPSPAGGRRARSNALYLAAATHLLAAAAMLVLLRGGLPGAAEDERLAFMAAHRAGWVAGWVLWQVAAVSLMAAYGALALRFRGVLSLAAMAASAAALSLDIASESRYIAVLPELRGEAFARLDRELEVLIGYGANGLYTVAFVLLVIAGLRALPRLALVLAIPVAAGGVALAIASLQHDARAGTVSCAVLFPALILWLVVVGRWMRSDAG